MRITLKRCPSIQVIMHKEVDYTSRSTELEQGFCEDCRNFSYDLTLDQTGLLRCESCAVTPSRA